MSGMLLTRPNTGGLSHFLWPAVMAHSYTSSCKLLRNFFLNSGRSGLYCSLGSISSSLFCNSSKSGLLCVSGSSRSSSRPQLQLQKQFPPAVSGGVLSPAYFFSNLLPLWMRRVASPPLSTGRPQPA